MKNETKNYKFLKPGEDDFYDINEYNRTLDSIDEELMNLEQKKLDTTGDSSQTVTAFEEEVLRENLESGETLSLSHGKIKKWFSEMKNIAFSGRASDIETDGAHRFVTDGEKKNWNSKVSAEGDISDTKIQSLDSVSSEFPIPEEGETSRQFFGKVRKFMQDFNNFKTGIITVGKLVNNGSTTAGGFALDARYGKTLFDLYSRLNSDLKVIPFKDFTYLNDFHRPGHEVFTINDDVAQQLGLPATLYGNNSYWYVEYYSYQNGWARQVFYEWGGDNRTYFRQSDNNKWYGLNKYVSNTDLASNGYIEIKFLINSYVRLEKNLGVVSLRIDLDKADVPTLNTFSYTDLPANIPEEYRPLRAQDIIRFTVDSAQQEGAYAYIRTNGSLGVATKYNGLTPGVGAMYTCWIYRGK